MDANAHRGRHARNHSNLHAHESYSSLDGEDDEDGGDDPLRGFGHVDDAIRDILLRYVKTTPAVAAEAEGGSDVTLRKQCEPEPQLSRLQSFQTFTNVDDLRTTTTTTTTALVYGEGLSYTAALPDHQEKERYFADLRGGVARSSGAYYPRLDLSSPSPSHSSSKVFSSVHYDASLYSNHGNTAHREEGQAKEHNTSINKGSTSYVSRRVSFEDSDRDLSRPRSHDVVLDISVLSRGDNDVNNALSVFGSDHDAYRNESSTNLRRGHGHTDGKSSAEGEYLVDTDYYEGMSEDWGNLALEVQARLHRRETLSRQSLSRWHSRTSRRLENRRTELLMAAAYHERRIVFGSFRRWQGRYNSRWQDVQQNELAARNYALTLMGRPFGAWKRFVLETRVHQREKLADLYHEAASRTASRCWVAWLGFWHRHRLSSQLAALSEYRLMKGYFVDWMVCGRVRRLQGFVMNVGREKRKWQKSFVAFSTWRMKTARKRLEFRAHLEDRAVKLALTSQKRITAQRYYPWCARATAKLSHRKALALMNKSIARVLYRFFHSWAQWSAMLKAERIVVAFCAARGKQNTFTRWRARVKQAVVDRGKEAMAAMFFAELQSLRYVCRPFLAWHGLVVGQRKAREEHKRALRFRKALLGDVAVEELRRYANNMLPFAVDSSSPSPWHQHQLAIASVKSREERRAKNEERGLQGNRQRLGSVPPFELMNASSVDAGASSPVAQLLLRQRSPIPLRGGGGGGEVATMPSVSKSRSPALTYSSLDHSYTFATPPPLPPHTSPGNSLDAVRAQQSLLITSKSPPLPPFSSATTRSQSPYHYVTGRSHSSHTVTSGRRHPPETYFEHESGASLTPSDAQSDAKKAAALLKRKVAEYTLLKQNEERWAGELKVLSEEYEWLLAAGAIAGDDDDEYDGSTVGKSRQNKMEAVRVRMSALREKQQLLAHLRNEIVFARAAITKALDGD